LNSGDYPELIFGGMGIVDLSYWANQGVFVSLDEYDPLSYPHTKVIFDAYPTIREKLTGSDGKLYALPSISVCLHCTYYSRMWFYMPWLRDKYNNRQPTTTAELTEYLRFIKNNDMNGNGNTTDEIPLIVSANETGTFLSYIAGAFVPWVGGSWGGGIAQQNGRVVDLYKDPQFREMLKYVNGLYKEGLIAPQSFSMSDDEFRGIVQASTNIVGSYTTAWTSQLLNTAEAKFVETFALAPVAGPNGVRYAPHGPQSDDYTAHFMVTDKCKDPDLAMALYDYFMIDDPQTVSIQKEFGNGPKGVGWDTADPGTLGLTGAPATWKQLKHPEQELPPNTIWSKAAPYEVALRNFFSGFQTEGVAEMERYLSTGDPSLVEINRTNPGFVEKYYNWFATAYSNLGTPDSYIVPNAIISEADSARISDINAALSPYKSQAVVEFFVGTRDPNRDADWNAYLAELDRYGDAEYLNIVQKYLKK
jgi:putative aldouronate transport system substrate-binding protein